MDPQEYNLVNGQVITMFEACLLEEKHPRLVNVLGLVVMPDEGLILVGSIISIYYSLAKILIYFCKSSH